MDLSLGISGSAVGSRGGAAPSMSVGGAAVRRSASGGAGARGRHGGAAGRTSGAAARGRGAPAVTGRSASGALDRGTGEIKLAPGATMTPYVPRGAASAEDKSEGALPHSCFVPGAKATSCKRAKVWSPEVENCFRIQDMGWRNLQEYVATHGMPDVWEESGFIKSVRAVDTGYIVYWRRYRECEDRYVNRVKLFKYD